MQERGPYRLGHVIADGPIGVGRDEAMGIPSHSLAERRLGIGQLIFGGEFGGQDKTATVEGVLAGDFELLLRCERLVVHEAGGGAVIGDDTEEALIPDRKSTRLNCSHRWSS